MVSAAFIGKTRIQQQEQALKAWYDQFDANKYRLLGTYGSAKEKLGEGKAVFEHGREAVGQKVGQKFAAFSESTEGNELRWKPLAAS